MLYLKNIQSNLFNQSVFLTMVFLFPLLVSGQKNHTFYVGHSLSDQIPDMVQSLANDHNETTFSWVYQGIPGAPLRWQWQRKYALDYGIIEPNYYPFYDKTHGLDNGTFDNIVLVESVPRFPLYIGETYTYIDSFYQYATKFNPSIKFYFYEPWHCLRSGTPTNCSYDIDSNPWRQRLQDDLPMWEGVVSFLNDKYKPVHPVCFIPAGQGMAKLYDSILAGTVPGINKIEDLFSDDIHLNEVGKYFIACIHFSMITGKSPIGLTNQLQVWWGGNFTPPSIPLAKKMQEIAWETVQNYPKSCLKNTTSTSLTEAKTEIRIAPNPVQDFINIIGTKDDSQYKIFNLQGHLAQSGLGNRVSVGNLPVGLYFISINEHFLKFVKF